MPAPNPIANAQEGSGDGQPVPGSSVNTAPTGDSPEVAALKAQLAAAQEQIRVEARKRGTAEHDLSTYRQTVELERAQQLADETARRQAAFNEALGPEGVAFYAELSALSQTDPVAAAKKLADWRASGAAQQQVQGGPSVSQQQSPAPAQQQVPPPPSGNPADGSLMGQQSSVDPYLVQAEASEAEFNRISGLVQDPATRNRVRRAVRDEGLYHYMNAAFMKTLSKMRQQG